MPSMLRAVGLPFRARGPGRRTIMGMPWSGGPERAADARVAPASCAPMLVLTRRPRGRPARRATAAARVVRRARPARRGARAPAADAELAERVLLSRSGLTRLVDRLEREGLVRREACDERRPRAVHGADRRAAWRGCATGEPGAPARRRGSTRVDRLGRRARRPRWPELPREDSIDDGASTMRPAEADVARRVPGTACSAGLAGRVRPAGDPQDLFVRRLAGRGLGERRRPAASACRRHGGRDGAARSASASAPRASRRSTGSTSKTPVRPR